MAISTGGKVCIFIGAIFVLGAIFMVSNPWIALFSLIAGISCMVQGANMKVREQERRLPTGYDSHYNTGLSAKRDTTSKSAI